MTAAALPRIAVADVPSAQAFYSSAVEAMRELPQPQYLEYAMQGESDGFAVSLLVIDHLVWLGIHRGSAPSTWHLRHRTDDYASEIRDESGTRYVTQRSFFDPTWYGTFRALRDGMLDYQDIERPVSTMATPAPTKTPDLRTIAVVRVMGTSIYRVADAGAATCSNGDPGHALRLTSRERVPNTSSATWSSIFARCASARSGSASRTHLASTDSSSSTMPTPAASGFKPTACSTVPNGSSESPPITGPGGTASQT
ncbi:MAG: hypothetical protein ABI329_06640 [Candidatus Tumulicola sp.]